MFFSVLSVVGFVGFASRILKNGLWFKKKPNASNWMGLLLMASAPLTILYEIFWCFPDQFNLFGISSPSFQHRILDEGHWLLDFTCQRILAGAIAVIIISWGSSFARDLTVYGPHTVLHMMIGGAYFALAMTASDKGSGGKYEIPSTLHLGVAFANGLNYARSYRARVLEILQGDKKKPEDLKKQE